MYYHASEKRRDKQRRYAILRKYGITIEELAVMLEKQHNRCAICTRHWTECKRANSRYDDTFLQYLFIDHDHTTGIVRALLCNNCNSGIAHFLENEEWLRNAIAYLRKHKRADATP